MIFKNNQCTMNQYYLFKINKTLVKILKKKK